MSYKILIVDDSAVVRSVLKKTIDMTGLPVESVEEACNGRAAVEILRDHDVDVVLADLNMPEMNGVEMTAEILGDPSFSSPPAMVIITTERNDARIQELRDHGIKGYVHKPFTPEQIREVLLEVMGECAV